MHVLLKRKKPKETEWIKTLRKAYPYGMNNKFGDKIASNKCEIIGCRPKPHTKISLNTCK